MEKTIRLLIALCVFFMMALGYCLITNNSYVWCIAFMLYASLIGLCIAQNKNAHTLKHFAYRDGPTGLKNRFAYEERIAKINKNIKNHNISALNLTVFDLNNLKHTNDAFGHKAGDLYILEASRLITNVYGYNNLYRFGGDEFVAVTNFKNPDKLSSLKTQLQKAVKDFNSKRSDFPFNVAVAVGFADLSPQDTCINDIFSRADTQMYINKKDIKKEASD